MKKVAILSIFAALVIAAAFLAQCGDDKSPCEELADKQMDCLKSVCKGKDCEACKCINDPKAEGCTSNGNTGDTTTEVKCEGETKKAAEEALKNFKCDDYLPATAIKNACQ